MRSDARVRRAKAAPVAEAGGVDLKSMTPEQRKVHRERMLAGEKLKKTLRNAGEALDTRCSCSSRYASCR